MDSFQASDFEKRLAEGPAINVPTITMEGDANGAPRLEPAAYAKFVEVTALSL